MRVPVVLEIVAQDSLPGVNLARKLRVGAPILPGAAVAIVGPAIFGIESAPILLFWDIEPVLSSTSATRIITLPQVEVDDVLKAITEPCLRLPCRRPGSKADWPGRTPT